MSAAGALAKQRLAGRIDLTEQEMKQEMGNRTKLFLWLLVALFAAPARAQNQDEPIKLKADLVSLTAAVTDRNGRALRSLKADDFTIYEDGARQRIEHFAATEEPFTLLLLLDISGSTSGDIELMKRAARNFLAELRFDDRVGVIVFSREVQMIGEFGDPRARLIAALEQIATAPGSATSRFSTATGTSFYDALYLALAESPLKQVEGRKAIICMSDGVDSTSMKSYKQ